MIEMKKVIQLKLNKEKQKREEKLDIQESCTICIEDFESNPQDEELLIKTHCGHLFHQKCLKGWIEAQIKKKVEKPECPSCRK